MTGEQTDSRLPTCSSSWPYRVADTLPVTRRLHHRLTETLQQIGSLAHGPVWLSSGHCRLTRCRTQCQPHLSSALQRLLRSSPPPALLLPWNSGLVWTVRCTAWSSGSAQPVQRRSPGLTSLQRDWIVLTRRPAARLKPPPRGRLVGVH